MATFKQGPRPEDNFTLISNRLARDPEIPIEAKGIYLFMRSHRDGWRMTLERIGEALGISKNRASKYLRVLIESGYIIREQGHDDSGHFGNVEYIIMSEPCPKNEEPVATSANSANAQVAPLPKNPADGKTGVRVFDPYKKTIHKKTNLFKEDHEEDSPIAGDGADDAGASPIETPAPDVDEFDEWWATVPRKVSKGQARKAFKAARKKADLGTLIDGMVSARERWAREGREKRYLPHPSTWLNAEGWLDEDGEWSPAPAVGASGGRETAREMYERLSTHTQAGSSSGARPGAYLTPSMFDPWGGGQRGITRGA